VLRTKVKYTDSTGFASAGGDYTYIFRLNSLFDPDYTGGGHQPMGHDELATLYDNYQVTKVTWHVYSANLDDTTLRPMRCAAWVNNVVTNAADQNEAEEQPDAKSGLAEPGIQLAHLKGTTVIANTFGLTPAQAKSSDNLVSAFGATPASIAYLHLRWYNGLATFAGHFTVHLTFDVECRDPKRLALS